MPCDTEKVWKSRPDAGFVPARDAYTTRRFLRWREYADELSAGWLVLSTKYGLITSESLIEEYEATPARARRDPAYMRMLRSQAREHGLPEASAILVLDREWALRLLSEAVPEIADRVKLRYPPAARSR